MRYIISLLLASASLALPAVAEVPQVVTDLPPVHSLVGQVMGDLGQPVLLLDKGADAHSFQLRPSQAADLAAAGLVVWVGPEMTPWLERALEGLSTAPQLRLLSAKGTHVQDYAAGAEDHDHAEEGDAHSGLDPHAWLDPDNGQIWLGLIAAELGRIDPENAATYSANAAKATQDLAALDAELAGVLEPVQARPIVVFHQAYGYFANHYGLNVAASVNQGDAAPTGAAHLSQVQTLLTANPGCLFPETNHDPKLVAQLAEATGAAIGGALDPEGAGLAPGPDLYARLMRGLAHTIADCQKG